MASTLSPSSVHRIILLVENDDRPVRTRKKKNTPYAQSYILKTVNYKWRAIYKLYSEVKPAPPLDYLDSLELAIVFKGEVDDADVAAIFAHGKPLQFWGCPPMLLSKIVEVFSALQKEPTCLDVTITALPDVYDNADMRPTEAWSQICSSHLPCYARTTVETLEERRYLRYSSHVISSSLAPAKAVAVEKFHVFSKTFRKRLALEVHSQLEPGTTGTQREQSSAFDKITIRLIDEPCLSQGVLSGTTSRSSATLLLLPEFASEVLGFLDRVHVGPSLLASRDLRDLICQLKQRLPLHNLTCASFGSVRWYDGACWLTVRHFQRDLPYTNVRSFKMPSTAGNESDCALIRYYLSNSHVAELRAPEGDNFPFAIKMLACLAARNFSVGLMHLHARGQRLCDYRSMDAVFGGMRMAILDLNCDEQQFVGLVKTTDVFRMPAIQRLRALKLTLTGPSTEAKKPRGRAVSKSPLWVSGIYSLRNCQHYRVDERYHSQWTHSHLRSIERKIVQICKEFESGKITDTVTHFEFRPRPPTEMNYAFSRDNLLVSKMKVEGMNLRDRINIFAWDVYRFRNASTGGYLTACVGRSAYSTESILHLVKGEVYPDASFVRY